MLYLAADGQSDGFTPRNALLVTSAHDSGLTMRFGGQRIDPDRALASAAGESRWQQTDTIAYCVSRISIGAFGDVFDDSATSAQGLTPVKQASFVASVPADTAFESFAPRDDDEPSALRRAWTL